MPVLKVYNPGEFSRIISNCQSLFEIDDCTDYLLDHAADIIEQNGIRAYNYMVTISKRRRIFLHSQRA